MLRRRPVFIRCFAPFFLTACGGLILASCGGQPDPPPGPVVEEASAEDPEVVVVDWLGQGVLYAAVVKDRRGELTHVQYASGEHEWVEASRLRPWTELTNRQIVVWSPRGRMQGVVIEERGFLVHVRFEDGTHTWFGKDQLDSLQGRPPTAPDLHSPSVVRRGVSPEQIVAGARGLAYWRVGGEVQSTQPWTIEVLEVTDGLIRVRYLSDDSEGTTRPKDILRIFEPPPAPASGMRVWLAGSSSIGVVEAREGSRFRVRTTSGQSTLERAALLADAPPIGAEQLPPGTHITVAWAQSDPYSGTVQRVIGENVLVEWHEESSPSEVPIADVMETWSAAE